MNALNLVFIMRFKATRKWSIVSMRIKLELPSQKVESKVKWENWGTVASEVARATAYTAGELDECQAQSSDWTIGPQIPILHCKHKGRRRYHQLKRVHLMTIMIRNIMATWSNIHDNNWDDYALCLIESTVRKQWPCLCRLLGTDRKLRVLSDCPAKEEQQRSSSVRVDRNKLLVVQGFGVIVTHVIEFVTHFM